ncbi:MAG: WD40/YVTN/BNR-like repeat-containing protein [Gemmatimonas sp.]
MAEMLYVGTRKGLFEVGRRAGGWEIAAVHFLGDPVTAVLDTGEWLYAALDLGHFGAKLWRRDRSGAWSELSVPAFPAKPDDPDDPHPWSLGKIWVLEPGGVPGRLWAGTMPGGLFRSDDAGASWQLVESLWRMPERKQWFGVAGGEQPGISSVLIDPRDPKDIRVGVSTAGVWASIDEGRSWTIINQGMRNEYMPPGREGEPMTQDIHRLARCPAHPEVVWCQHHSGVFRSEDGGANWIEITAIQPSKFGFAVAAHPTDRNTAWFVPATKDERRIPVDGKVVVARTRDGGKSFDVLTNGLPQRHAYDLTWRHGLCIDETGERLAFGTTSGGLWITEDGGDSWTAPEARLPPISVVRFAGV